MTEARYPCPVCLGVKMEKLELRLHQSAPTVSGGDGPAVRPEPNAPGRPEGTAASGETLVLDHCARCGGVWFEVGEVQRLRRTEAELLWREIVRREEPHHMLCHSCRSPLARTATECGVCSWRVELDCPTCARPLETAREGGMSLDYCKRCKGVWFDHDELAGIWRLEMGAAVARRRGGHEVGSGDMLRDALYFDPFLLYYGAHAAGHVAGATLEGLAHVVGGAGGAVGDVAGAVGEVAGAAGDAAAGVFEVIVEIISGIFG